MEKRMKSTGRVKWWSSKKGFGFIVGEDAKEYFVHYTKLIGDKGHKNLEENQSVQFTPTNTAKGPQATEVEALNA